MRLDPGDAPAATLPARRRGARHGARQRLGPAPPLRAAGGPDRRDGERRLHRPAQRPRPRARRGPGGRAPAPGLRPHARAPRGRARRAPPAPCCTPRRPSARASRATCTTRPTRRSPASRCASRRRRRTPRRRCATSCARPSASPPRRWRSCSRLARELRPAALDDLGLDAALRTQVGDFARRARLRDELALGARRARRARARRAARRLPRRPGGAVEHRAPRRRERASASAPSAPGEDDGRARSPTTAAASTRRARAPGSGSWACASAPCWPAAASLVRSAPGAGTVVELRRAGASA